MSGRWMAGNYCSRDLSDTSPAWRPLAREHYLTLTCPMAGSTSIEPKVCVEHQSQ